MGKKFALTDEVNARGLHRIVALRDIPRYNVKKGDLGGFIKFERNLSQEGDCWVRNDAEVFDGASVYENACVSCNARVYGNSLISDYAHVYGNAEVYGFAIVRGNAQVSENAEVDGGRISGKAAVKGNAKIYGSPRISGNAWIHENALIFGKARVYGNANICEDAWIRGKAEVYGDAWVGGNAQVCENAKVHGKARVKNDTVICGNTTICNNAYKDSKICEDGCVESTPAKNTDTNSDVSETSSYSWSCPCCCSEYNIESTVNKGEKYNCFSDFIFDLLFLNVTNRKELSNIFNKIFGKA